MVLDGYGVLFGFEGWLSEGPDPLSGHRSRNLDFRLFVNAVSYSSPRRGRITLETKLLEAMKGVMEDLHEKMSVP